MFFTLSSTLKDTHRRFCAFVGKSSELTEISPPTKHKISVHPTVQNTGHGSGWSKVDWTTGGWHTFVTKSAICFLRERERERLECNHGTTCFWGKKDLYYCKGVVGWFSQDRVLQNQSFPYKFWWLFFLSVYLGLRLAVLRLYTKQGLIRRKQTLAYQTIPWHHILKFCPALRNDLRIDFRVCSTWARS